MITSDARAGLRKEVAADIPTVLNASDREDTNRLVKLRVEKYRVSFPKPADWMEENIPESLTVFMVPAARRGGSGRR
jgi:putative transposase